VKSISWAKFVDPLDGMAPAGQLFSPGEPYDGPHGRYVNVGDGLVPVREGLPAFRAFNLYIGHTNFDIDSAFVEQVAKLPGVETLDVFTRYRFRLGIGRCFKPADVRQSINDLVCPPRRTGLGVLTSLARADGRDWALWRQDGLLRLVYGGREGGGELVASS